MTRLFRVTSLIRQAGPTDLFAKALSRSRNSLPDQYDIAHVGEKYPKLAASRNAWLQTRLGRAITQRRRYLSYIHDHHDKLEGKHQHDNVSVAQPDSSSRPSTFLTKASTLAPGRITAQMLTADDASDAQSDARSYTTISPSVAGDLDSSAINKIPNLTDLRKDPKKEFECPFCFRVKKFQSERNWRQHVFSDLRAYLCTFRSCDSPYFGDMNDWFRHEMQCHRVRYRCHVCSCSDFEQEDRYLSHVRKEHPEILDGGEEQQILDMARSPLDRIPAHACPCCLDWADRLLERSEDPSSLPKPSNYPVTVAPNIFKRHLASHLEQLALFAVPIRLAGGDIDSNAAIDEDARNSIRDPEISSLTFSDDDSSAKSSSQDRHESAGPEILYSAVSIFESNHAHERREGGIPYLNYVVGEVFDVISIKGEFLLACKQNDNTKTVGLILEKHIDRIWSEIPDQLYGAHLRKETKLDVNNPGMPPLTSRTDEPMIPQIHPEGEIQLADMTSRRVGLRPESGINYLLPPISNDNRGRDIVTNIARTAEPEKQHGPVGDDLSPTRLHIGGTLSGKGQERTAEIKQKANDVEEYIKATHGSRDPFADQVNKAALKRLSRVSQPSDSGSSNSIENGDRTTMTSTANNEIRLRVDGTMPLSLQLSGDMEGRHIQLVPAENGMTDLVIGGNNTRSEGAIYRSEKGVSSDKDRRFITAGRGRRDIEDEEKEDVHVHALGRPRRSLQSSSGKGKERAPEIDQDSDVSEGYTNFSRARISRDAKRKDRNKTPIIVTQGSREQATKQPTSAPGKDTDYENDYGTDVSIRNDPLSGVNVYRNESGSVVIENTRSKRSRGKEIPRIGDIAVGKRPALQHAKDYSEPEDETERFQERNQTRRKRSDERGPILRRTRTTAYH